MTAAPDSPSVELLAVAKMWRLASRTFAAEIDEPFYRALQGLAEAPRLRALDLAPLDTIDTADTERLLADLAVEYCRLFIGPDPVCPPYVSVQRGHPHLGGHDRRGVDALLDMYRLEVHLPDGVPILNHDHVSVTFALLDELYTTAAGVPATHLPPDRAATAAQQVVDTCLRDWAPRYLDSVSKAARHTSYRNLSRLFSLVLAQHTE